MAPLAITPLWHAISLACSYFTQLLEFKDLVEPIGPIVYWDQGHEHVFNDPTADPHWDTIFHAVMCDDVSQSPFARRTRHVYIV